MTYMLATIDPDTERKLVRDRQEHGVAYMRVLSDGRIEHVPMAGECKHERADIYGVHAVWCDVWLPDGECNCNRVHRRCCECGAKR